MPIDERRAYDHYRWATRYEKMGMEKKAKAHIQRAMHYGAPTKKRKLGRMDPGDAFRVLGASTTSRSTDPFPERSAKFRYETLKEMYKTDAEKLDEVQRAYDTLLYHNLIDPVDQQQQQRPSSDSRQKRDISTVYDTLSTAYDTLGVTQGNITEAKRAYRKRALEEHPDKTHGTGDQMQVLNNAWDVIQKAHGLKFGNRTVRTRAV
jgi:hypothetical protein